MAKYFFDQLDKGKARRDAQKAQNQAVLANLIRMKQADDAQIRKQSNERFMQEYGFDYDKTKQDDAQAYGKMMQDDKQFHEVDVQERDIQFKEDDRLVIEDGLNTRLTEKLAMDKKINWKNQEEAMKRLKQAGLQDRQLQAIKEEGQWKRLVLDVETRKEIQKMQETGAMDRLKTQIQGEWDLQGLRGEQRMEQLNKQLDEDFLLKTTLKDMDYEQAKMVQNEIGKRLKQDIARQMTMQQSLFGHERGQQKRDQEFKLEYQEKGSDLKMDEMEYGSNLKKDEMKLGAELESEQIDQKYDREGNLIDKRLKGTMDQLVKEIEFKKGEGQKERELKAALQKDDQRFKADMVQLERENNLIDNILNLDIANKQKAKDFQFQGHPFLLGKVTNMLGMNYKEGAVLDKVTSNMPALTQAVSIARNLPDVESDSWVGGALGIKKEDPRKTELLSVLTSYKQNLDQKGDRFWNPTPWKNESSSTKARATALFNDVDNLIQMLNAPQTPINPANYVGKYRTY